MALFLIKFHFVFSFTAKVNVSKVTRRAILSLISVDGDDAIVEFFFFFFFWGGGGRGNQKDQKEYWVS